MPYLLNNVSQLTKDLFTSSQLYTIFLISVIRSIGEKKERKKIKYNTTEKPSFGGTKVQQVKLI